ncbi:hypothetical protein QTL86_18580 [Cellulosilyticum sp. ST5]|uniref:hypothetical protein n=1 Tax=Cellulosilyticum sp. ST5 TaxID=3055805 RepID=UPI0039778BF5
MERNIKVIFEDNDDKYIDYKEFGKLLNINNRGEARAIVAKENNIRTLRRKGIIYYSLQDTLRVLEEASTFYSKYYTQRYIEEELNEKWYKDRFDKGRISVPYKYTRVLERVRSVFDKEVVKEIIHNTANKDSFIFEGGKYYRPHMVIKILGISANRQDSITSLRKDWGVEDKWFNGKIAYNAKQVEEVKEKIQEFYDQHYTIFQVEEKLGDKIKDIDKIAIKKKIETKYWRFLEKECNPSRCKYCYEKGEIHQLETTYASNPKYTLGINQYNNGFIDELLLKKYKSASDSDRVLKDEKGEIYVNARAFRDILNIAEGTAPKESVVQENNIRTMKVGGVEYFNFQDVERTLKEVKEYYSQYYSKEYIINDLKQKWSPKIFKRAVIKVPKKYTRMLEHLQYVYEKEAVDKIILNSEDEKKFIIEGKKYFVSNEVVELLGIKNKQDAITVLRNIWNVNSIRKNNRIGYLAEEIESVKLQVEKFYNNYDTATEALKKLEGLDLQTINNIVERKDIEEKYYYYLEDVYNPSRSRSCYNKKDIDKLIKEYKKGSLFEDKRQGCTYEGNRYYTTEEAIQILEIKRNPELAMAKLCDDWNIETLKAKSILFKDDTVIRYQNIYNAHQVDSVRMEIRAYYEKHYTRFQAIEFASEVTIKKYLRPITLQSKYKRYMQKSYDYKCITVLYSKEELEGVLGADINDTYSRNQVIELLNLSKVFFDKFIKGYNLKPIYVQGLIQTRYSKQEIDYFVQKKENFYREYVSLSNVGIFFGKKKLTGSIVSKEKLPRIDLPLYARDKNNASYSAVKIEDVKSLAGEYLERKEIAELSNVFEEDPLTTFYTRLDIYKEWGGFEPKSKYTAKSWFRFVEGWLSRTTVKGSRMQQLINKLVFCTPVIKVFLDRTNKREIYMLTSKEINLVMNSIEYYSYCYVMELYFKEIGSDPLIANDKKFKVEDIRIADEIFAKVKKKRTNHIYSIEEYSDVFNYCTEVKRHVECSIQEIIEKNRYVHLSTWLYVMLHLNNAWRNGDIKDFPIIGVDDVLTKYNINGIEWFASNEVNLEMARLVLFKINQWEFKISKTQVKGVFFCSDELAPAFTTAVLMLELLNKDRKVHSDFLMEFGTQENRVNEDMFKKFFKESNLENFKFSSLKFNKTVMTYLYYIANLSGDSKALVYCAELRGHTNNNTAANHYIEMNQRQMEKLSKQLFERGEFGYIPALLIQKINGGEVSFEEVTEEIERLNDEFGDIIKLNTAVAFMNALRRDKVKIITAINSMSLQEAQTLLQDIYLRKIPSKQSLDILCMCGKKSCREPEKRSCFECIYHIPTIYALLTLCEEIKKDIQLIMITSLRPKQLKLAYSIEKKKKILLEAMHKFGKDYVYEFLNYNRNDFIKILSEIPKPEDILQVSN